MEFSAGKHPEKIAANSKGKDYTYLDLLDSSKNLASYLVNSGIKKGDRVAIFMNNSWACLVSIYGITMSGAVFLVINPQTKSNKLNFILTDSGSKVVLTESGLVPELLTALEGLTEVNEVLISGVNPTANSKSIKFSDFDETVSVHQEVTFPRIIPNDLAALIYTSGSTGFPKGVMMTHQSMVFTSWSLIEYLRLNENDSILLVLPLAFDYGLYQLIMSVTIGGTILVEQSFNFPPAIFRKIDSHKPSVFPGVPSIYAMMIATHKKTGIIFESVRTITNTAAALPEEFVSDLKLIFPNARIFKMYGLTECKRVSYLEPELLDLKPHSVGKAIPGTEVFLLSPEGKPVMPGETGILHVRGPHVMAGYWNNEILTNEMLKPGLIPGERVLCAHDLFKMDEDGFLYFQGRNDDIIKTRGEKVSPIEVENVIYKLEGVREVAVLGIPDVFLGESIIAFITLHDFVTFEEKDIQQHCSKNLEPFMVPQKIVILQEMPKSSNGKFDKSELKKRLSE